MGQLQSLIKPQSPQFVKIEDEQTPKRARILDDPRSPTAEVCRTPIEKVGQVKWFY